MQHPQAGLVHSLGPVGDDPTAFRGRQEQRLHAKFGTQVLAKHSGRMGGPKQVYRRCSSCSPPRLPCSSSLCTRQTTPPPLVQANALFRKNGVQQRRAWVQTLVTVSLPIVFCLLLFLLQKLLNNALDTVDNRVGQRARWHGWQQ